MVGLEPLHRGPLSPATAGALPQPHLSHWGWLGHTHACHPILSHPSATAAKDTPRGAGRPVGICWGQLSTRLSRRGSEWAFFVLPPPLDRARARVELAGLLSYEALCQRPTEGVECFPSGCFVQAPCRAG